jgi:hypothetical protein
MGAPTLGFDLLYAFVIVRLARRDLIWINVTPHPAADWIARQITETFPWNEAPRYLIRDRDQVYGVAVRHRLRAMGIRDKLRHCVDDALDPSLENPAGDGIEGDLGLVPDAHALERVLLEGHGEEIIVAVHEHHDRAQRQRHGHHAGT